MDAIKPWYIPCQDCNTYPHYWHSSTYTHMCALIVLLVVTMSKYFQLTSSMRMPYIILMAIMSMITDLIQTFEDLFSFNLFFLFARVANVPFPLATICNMEICVADLHTTYPYLWEQWQWDGDIEEHTNGSNFLIVLYIKGVDTNKQREAIRRCYIQHHVYVCPSQRQWFVHDLRSLSFPPVR